MTVAWFVLIASFALTIRAQCNALYWGVYVDIALNEAQVCDTSTCWKYLSTHGNHTDKSKDSDEVELCPGIVKRYPGVYTNDFWSSYAGVVQKFVNTDVYKKKTYGPGAIDACIHHDGTCAFTRFKELKKPLRKLKNSHEDMLYKTCRCAYRAVAMRVQSGDYTYVGKYPYWCNWNDIVGRLNDLGLLTNTSGLTVGKKDISCNHKSGCQCEDVNQPGVPTNEGCVWEWDDLPDKTGELDASGEDIFQ